jgi:hypothetical protein
MALSNYSELQTSIGNWLKDTSLTSVIPDFVTLAEARFNRELRVPEMEAVSSASVSTESVALPTGFLEMRSIWLEESPDRPLDYFPPHQLKTTRASAEAGTPTAYTIIGTAVYLSPTPSGTHTVNMAYYGRIPALASNSTNWLLTNHPDIYLAGSLSAGEAFGWNDERIGLWNATASDGIAMLNEQGVKMRTGANPTMRSMRAFS